MRSFHFVPLMLLAVGACSDDASVQPYDVSLTTAEETALPLPLIPTHPDDASLSFTVTTQPQHGTLDGAFPTAIYTPATEYNGDDVVVVRVDDSTSTVDVTLHIHVTAVNDAPTTAPDV